MAEVIQRLKATDAVLLWASARDTALPFYQRFGFETVEGSGFTPPQTGRPHHIIELDLTAHSLTTADGTGPAFDQPWSREDCKSPTGCG